MQMMCTYVKIVLQDSGQIEIRQNVHNVLKVFIQLQLIPRAVKFAKPVVLVK